MVNPSSEQHTEQHEEQQSVEPRVRIQYINEMVGRGVVAHTAIKAGELVVTASPYAHVLDFEKAHMYCHNCFAPIYDPIDKAVRSELTGQNSECEDCGYTVYCSTECRQEYEPFHKQSKECDHLSNLLQYLTMVDNRYVNDDKFTATHMIIKILGRRALELKKREESESRKAGVIDRTNTDRGDEISENDDQQQIETSLLSQHVADDQQETVTTTRKRAKHDCASHCHHHHHHHEHVHGNHEHGTESIGNEEQEFNLIYEDFERLVSNRSLHTKASERLVLRDMAFVLLNHVLKQVSNRKIRRSQREEYRRLFEKGLDSPEIIEMICKDRANSVGLKGDRWQRPDDYIFTHPEDPVGYGVFPTMSYFNHSCTPNCENIEKDMKIYVYAVRDIEPGEQLTISYVSLDSSNERRKHALQSSFMFTCECAEGSDPRNCNKEFVTKHLCPKCRSSLLIPVEGEFKCFQCGYSHP